MSRHRNSRSAAAVSGLFHFNPATRIPAPVQIEEQVKVALAFGKLRPGDLLVTLGAGDIDELARQLAARRAGNGGRSRVGAGA